MPTSAREFSFRWWVAGGLLGLALVIGVGYVIFRDASANQDHPQGLDDVTSHSAAIQVDVVHPRKGAMERTTTQPGTVEAFQRADLYAEVSGYLKEQDVDIGDVVKKGQVLARIAVPDLEKEVERKAALLEEARARVKQMKAHITTARADVDAAKAGVVQAEAAHKSAEAWERFRNKQYARMKNLFLGNAIKEQLVDEAREQFEAAAEKVRAAVAAISTAKAQLAAAEAKVVQAQADVIGAESQVRVAEADLQAAQVQVEFATLTSPYDGVITRRTLFPGDFVRAATGGSPQPPLLTAQRTDLMRVIVQVPDRDVPYVNPGDPAVVQIDALPGKKFHAKVSRIGGAEDPETRLMRVEIDLPNPKGELRQGMYGRVTIVLENGRNTLSIPSSCLVGKSAGGLGTVYAVRDGHARRATVRLGNDNGVRVAILEGLTENDPVILYPPGDLADGTPVVISSDDKQGH